MTSNHKWQVNVYLGKERYQQIEEVSKTLGVSVSQVVRIMIETGMYLADVYEGVANNGKTQL